MNTRTHQHLDEWKKTIHCLQGTSLGSFVAWIGMASVVEIKYVDIWKAKYFAIPIH